MLGFAGDVVRARPTGTWINGQYRWAAADGWVPGGIDVGLDKRDAAAGLARLWLRSFGPGTRADLQWWAGWTAATTTRALADVGAVEVELDDAVGFVLPDDLEPGRRPRAVGRAAARVSTRRRWAGSSASWYLDPEVAAAVFDRNGNGGPTVWVDGRIVGSWVQRRDGTIAVRLLTDVGAEQRDEIDRAATGLQELLGDVRFSVRFPAPAAGRAALAWRRMGFLDGITGNASRVDPGGVAQEYGRLLAQGEQVHAAYQLVRDVFIFTDRRLILVDKQGVTGRKVQYHSMPYKSITHFSVETAGTFDLDAELTIWISGGQGDHQAVRAGRGRLRGAGAAGRVRRPLTARTVGVRYRLRAVEQRISIVTLGVERPRPGPGVLRGAGLARPGGRGDRLLPGRPDGAGAVGARQARGRLRGTRRRAAVSTA